MRAAHNLHVSIYVRSIFEGACTHHMHSPTLRHLRCSAQTIKHLLLSRKGTTQGLMYRCARAMPKERDLFLPDVIAHVPCKESKCWIPHSRRGSPDWLCGRTLVFFPANSPHFDCGMGRTMGEPCEVPAIHKIDSISKFRQSMGERGQRRSVGEST